MAGLYLGTGHLQAIAQAAVDRYPSECCGLLVGRRVFGHQTLAQENHREEDHREVVAVVATENVWKPAGPDGEVQGEDRGHSDRDRYSIDPSNMLAVQKSAREQGLEIIGIFHSHPDHRAVPSECDRRLAWPVYSYVIVSVVKAEVVEIKSWRLDDQHRFQSEPVKMIGSSTNKAPFLS
jgi:proteasome lid subunit RPN8/RPN11